MPLLKAIEGSACAKDTMVVVTYDEFGGQWDHVPPPGQDGAPARTTSSVPGTRIPAVVICAAPDEPFAVDHTQYDTTVDPRDDRAAVGPAAAQLARRGRAQPLAVSSAAKAVQK